MRALSHLDQIAFADLCSKLFDARFDRPFPANGNFVKQKRGRKEYFYYKRETVSESQPERCAIGTDSIAQS
ncbi:hypothetical protein MPEAHAMD_0998 [Methylobacterium frigidaeris]|uniref:Uncharacterized protein n=1 Tax=Methylobacterium frigidaeris TaxID=2038277 RepID=A0AA37H7K1_9HYPH|nr:hypothetical protein MPEAHAMD_0998 [Methylobacterium frigidaeris]